MTSGDNARIQSDVDANNAGPARDEAEEAKAEDEVEDAPENESYNDPPPMRTSEQLAEAFGTSPATINRFKTILEEGSQERIKGLRSIAENRASGPAVRTLCEQVQPGKLQSPLQSLDSSAPGRTPAPAVGKDNLDFRTPG
jgi:hypothetical protein